MTTNKKQVAAQNAPGGFVLFMAWVGALVYFVQNSQGLGGFVLAVLKSLVWPAYVLYAVMQLLKIS